MMGYDFESSTEMAEENFGQDEMYSISSAKAQKELGWKPTIALKEGIREVIQWVEESWEKIKNKPLEYVHKD